MGVEWLPLKAPDWPAASFEESDENQDCEW